MISDTEYIGSVGFDHDMDQLNKYADSILGDGRLHYREKQKGYIRELEQRVG